MPKLSNQGYYKWLKDPLSQRDWDDAHALDALLDLHAEGPTLGYQVRPPTSPTPPGKLTPVEFEMIDMAADAALRTTHP